MVYQAEELIKREMVTMIRSDIVNHPTAQQIENLTHKKSKNAAQAVFAATRAALEIEPLESFTEKEIAHAKELLANEMEFVRSKMAHGDLPIESYTKVWEECYAQVSVFWSKGSLRWLNTVLAVCVCSHLPNHGKRKVAALKRKLGE